MSKLNSARYHITGIVQGVGFRPFVYSLATHLALTGWVKNTSAGVEIAVDGPPQAIQEFTARLQEEAPPLARIDNFLVESRPTNGYTKFTIVHSEAIPHAFQPISPDVSVCNDCIEELFDPDDRRYRYPFTNCTNCGPRFTIIEDIPYDRPNTTMAAFDLCPDCMAEYSNPLDRRFHAQPVACPICGPQVWLEFNPQTPDPTNHLEINSESSQPHGYDAIITTQQLLRNGKIVAIKGLGGFHLACDATNLRAVKELRKRKLRVDKPFAVMMPNLNTIKKHCTVGETEAELLKSRERPILILPRRQETSIVDEIAPHQETIGVMLPYTPLHYLLFADRTDSKSSGIDDLLPLVLVMTSGNLSEEPIATDNDEARQRLSTLADAFLMHDRPIRTRCDDSVARIFYSGGSEVLSNNNHLTDITILRRSRGYAPTPLNIPWEGKPLLATGAELKNSFCLTRDQYAFLSHHIGDMENYETLLSFEDGITHFERLFKIHPEALAYDLHPNYLATRYALERADREGMPAIGVQHHHAHIAACMAEHGLTGDQPVIGVSFDGTGYGEDGAIWGGEFLIADYAKYMRYAHLSYAPLPGGDVAIRKPARIALAYLWHAGIDWDTDLAPLAFFSGKELVALRSQLENNINTPMTSSMGRLFDAVAALVNVRQQVNYEAQAAIELEALVDPSERKAYSFKLIHPGGNPAYKANYHTPIQAMQIDPKPMIADIISDLRGGLHIGKLSARFHNGLAVMVKDVCISMRKYSGIHRVALSGGVWQNMVLLQKTVELLRAAEFDVLLHSLIPPNDGGLALGQAAIAAYRIKTD